MRGPRHCWGKPRTLTGEMETSEWTLLQLFMPLAPELPESPVGAHPSLLGTSTPHPTPRLDDDAEIRFPRRHAPCRSCPVPGLLGLGSGFSQTQLGLQRGETMIPQRGCKNWPPCAGRERKEHAGDLELRVSVKGVETKLGEPGWHQVGS